MTRRRGGNAFKHGGRKDGVAIKRNRLLWEIRYAGVATGYESN